MTPSDALVRAGTLLYGADWKAPLARELGLTDRTLYRWERGEAPPFSHAVWMQIDDLMRLHSVSLTALQHELQQVRDDQA